MEPPFGQQFVFIPGCNGNPSVALLRILGLVTRLAPDRFPSILVATHSHLGHNSSKVGYHRTESMANSGPKRARKNVLANLSRDRTRPAQNSARRFRMRALLLGLGFLSCLSPKVSHAQNRDVVCRDGDGEFHAEFPTGVRVSVGPGRNDGLAARVCQAELTWNDQKLVVASGAAQVDIDAFGVDLGVGGPAMAIQVKKSKGDCCMEYDVYSLRQPPTLVRRITGGEYFSAADTDLDGRLEIWTDDAASLAGFEALRAGDFDFLPPVVLRFVRGRLLDAGAEFRSSFDEKIQGEKAKLTALDLGDFKTSDGKLTDPSLYPATLFVHLKSVKAKILDIVWAYLYSGREKEAWRSLAEMWPAADVERIRGAILGARDHGIRAQLDGTSTPIRPGREIHVKIFDGTLYVAATPGMTPKGAKAKEEIIPPRAILMERQPPMTPLEVELAKTESQVELVIDSAGKVRSVEQVGKFESVDEGLLRSTSGWKFIPAFSQGQPVASRILLGVSLRK